MAQSAPDKPRVLIVGWDGGAWDAFRPLVAKGWMPNLAALMARGCHGVMRSTIPPHTAAAWTTMLTGLHPGRHGIFSFFEGRMPGEANEAVAEGAAPVSARSLRARSLEDILGAAGRRVLLVNLPLGWPPKPVNGVLITGMLTPKDADVFTFPPELRGDLVDYVVDVSHSPDAMERTAQLDRLDDATLVRECTRMERARTENVLRLAGRERFDFAMVLLTGTDRIFHRLWPRLASLADETDEIARLLREFVAQLDASLGLLTEAFADATALLVSDHGFGPRATRVVRPDVWFEREGLLARRDAGKPRRRPIRRLIGRAVRAFLPVRLARRLLRSARSRAERMSDVIDFERSLCRFTPVEAAYGGVRLLDRTRASLSPDARRRVEDRILDSLRRMTDPATGEAVVTRAWRRDELYGGDCPAFVPEILFEFREGCTGAVDPDADDVVADATEGQSGTHRADGMFVLAGKAVRPLGPVGPLHLVDVAPLTLRLCSVGAPADLDGRLPVELLDPEAIGTTPDSTGSGESPDAPSSPPGPAPNPYTPEQEQQVKEHLRRLGYL